MSVIKRKKSEADEVAKILKNTRTEFLLCYGKPHPFGKNVEVKVDPGPGKKKMVMIYHCPECKTKRLDSYIVRIDKNGWLSMEEFVSRDYEHPEGYSVTADQPRIQPIERQEEWINRQFQFGSTGKG